MSIRFVGLPVIDTLKGARDLVAQGWTKGVFARDAADHAVTAVNGKAVCWCASGAILWMRGGDFFVDHDRKSAEALFKIAAGTRSISTWNDDPARTQAEVIAAFDKAIAIAEARS